MGSSNKASKEAQRAEDQRRAEIAAAQKRIDAIFGSPERESDIQGLETATRGFLQSDLDRQKLDTDRNLKFALARGGLSKGSVDVDKNRRLAEDYLRGIVEVERRSKTAGTTLRGQDQDTKNSLFTQILGGLDSTTAAQQATLALKQNVALAKSESLQGGLGDLFGDFTNIFKRSETAKGDRQSIFDFNTLYGARQRPLPVVSGGLYPGG